MLIAADLPAPAWTNLLGIARVHGVAWVVVCVGLIAVDGDDLLGFLSTVTLDERVVVVEPVGEA